MSRIHEDNTGAIFMVKNSQIGDRTKHIDTRHHYIKQQVEKGLVEVVYVNTLDNPADIMMKNGKEVLHKKFSPMILDGHKCDSRNKEDVTKDGIASYARIGCTLAIRADEHQAIQPAYK